MNSVQLHLALTHVPVILSLTGLVVLIAAFISKNKILTRTSYVIIAVAGIAALPVYFSGEGTEEAVENLPGVGEAIIERHEEVAKLAMISIAIAGAMALTALFSFKWQAIAKASKIGVLVLAISSGALMAQTAHLGGQIRHSEIRSGALMQNANDAGETNAGEAKQNEKDDD